MDKNGDAYNLQQGESLKLVVSLQTGSTALLTKVVTNNNGTAGEYEFTFAAADTANMTARNYIYYIALSAGTEFKVVIPPSRFILNAAIALGEGSS